MKTNTQQPLGPVSTVRELGSQTLPDGTIDELADVLIQNEAGFVNYALTAIALKKKLDAAPRDSRNRLVTPVKGCYSFKEFCKTHLGRTREAVYKAMRLVNPKPRKLPGKGKEKPKKQQSALQCAPELASEIYKLRLRIDAYQNLLHEEYFEGLPPKKPSIIKLRDELGFLHATVEELRYSLDQDEEDVLELKRLEKQERRLDAEERHLKEEEDAA